MDENAAIGKIWELITHKLSGEATGEELSELQHLLQQHPQEAFSLEVLENIWNEDTTPNHYQYSEHQYRLLLRRMQKSGIDTSKFFTEEEHLISAEPHITPAFKKLKFTAKKVLLTVCLLSIIFLSVYYFNKPINEKTKIEPVAAKCEITTKYGSKTSVVLPDGTKVWVNAASKLIYDNDYGNTTREVNLVGEAFFDVVHNAAKPFVIHTSKMDIRVLGTQFNVRCYPDESKIETSLIKGQIEVTLKKNPAQKIYLKPNEKLILMNDDVNEIPVPELHNAQAEQKIKVPEQVSINHLTYQAIDSAIVETSWMENKLEFVSETFEDVAKKMEKWYGVNITITNEKLKQTHLTGSFENETIEQALKALQLTIQFTYTNNENNIIITK